MNRQKNKQRQSRYGSTAITGAGSLGAEYKYPRNYRPVGSAQVRSLVGSGRVNEAGLGSGLAKIFKAAATRRSAALVARGTRTASGASTKTQRGQAAARSSAAPAKPTYQTKGVSKTTGGALKSGKPARYGPSRPTPTQSAQLSGYQAGRASVRAAQKTATKQDKARVGRKAAGYGAAAAGIAAAGAATRYEIQVRSKPQTSGGSSGLSASQRSAMQRGRSKFKSGASRQSAAKPKVGDTKVLGGRKARYDGRNWVAVKR